MEDYKVSIVMTCYNSINTIEKAVDSVTSQSYKNLQLVIVDDCSKDGSYDKIQELASKDNRILVIRNKINKGAGLSRRIGVTHTDGDYIGFVDSDDYISNDFVQTLMYTMLKEKADIVWSSFYIIRDNKVSLPPCSADYKVYDKSNIHQDSIKAVKYYLNATLSSRKLWDKVSYSSLRFVEDTPTAFMIYFFASKGVYIPYYGYYYVQHKDSLCNSSSDMKKAIYRVLGVIECNNFLKEQSKSINKEVFIIRLREAAEYIKRASFRQVFKFKKELIIIFNYFLHEIL